MKLFEIIQEYFWGYNAFFYWRNTIEILFFTLLIYYFSVWLKKDRHKNLLPYFYGYCFLALFSHVTQLTTMSYFLFLFAPVATMLFITIHQKTLQKNFVALKNITPAKRILGQWPEVLIRSCLVALNDNKEIQCVIENKDSLEDFIESPLILHANMDQTLLHILQESDIFNQHQMIWLNTQGKLVGLNTTIKEDIILDLTNEESPNIHSWKENAILLSSKTDSLFLRILPTKRTFDLVFNGKLVDNINANNALHILQKYATTQLLPVTGDVINENYSQKDIFKQRTN